MTPTRVIVGLFSLVILGLSLVLSPYYLDLLALVAAYAVASLAQNLLSGYGDVPSLGNVAFFATGAYVGGSLIGLAGLPPFFAFVLAVLAAGALGFVVGLPAFRISGMHLAIVTVALVFVAQEIMGQWDQNHGQNGVTVETPNWLLTDRGLYLAAVVVGLISYLAVRNLLQSRSGRAIIALSDNHFAAGGSGVNPVAYRLTVFVLSGLLTGAAGVIYLYYAHTVTPGAFTLDLSLAFLTMMILGGTRSLGGSLLGAAIIGLLPEALRHLPAEIAHINMLQSVYALYAIALLITLRFFPEGIWNAVAARVPGRGRE